MTEIIAYASSTRPNHLWSAAQFNNALPKNRTECDIPLVSASALAAKDAELSRMRDALLAAKEVVAVAEGMTSCRSDDDFIWSAQKKIDAALNGGSDAT